MNSPALKTAQTDSEKSARLYDLIQAKRLIEKELDELKDYFKGWMEQEGLEALVVGGFVLTASARTRGNFDLKGAKKAATNAQREWLAQFESETQYTVFDIKAA